MKYFLYARKSTEDEEHQIMSIEAQLFELSEYAKREKIDITEKFIESKSAKSPGREIFGKMIIKIQESKEPIGILAWHPDRLARNSIDGGQIIYLIDGKKIAALRFPTFWFEPTPQGLFMLQVAFGQSKYYSDNLSENVKRGIRQKLRRGESPHYAPIGYVNNLKTRTIEPDPFKGRVIGKAFEEYANGMHTLESLGKRLSFLGIVSRTGKPLPKATLSRMLTNPVHCGLIRHNGETYPGGFAANVSIELFEKVQKVFKQNQKGHYFRKRHHFALTGLLKCGECGAAITAQNTKGHGGWYVYYRCTKRLGPCKQGYVQQERLSDQIRAKVREVAISEDWAKKMLNKVKMWENEIAQSSQSSAQNIKAKIKETELQLDRLVNAFLDGSIEKSVYLEKKDGLIKTKTSLEQKKADFGRKTLYWIEPLRQWILDAQKAEKLASSNDLPELKSFAEKIGTNRRLVDKSVRWDLAKPWNLPVEFRGSFIWWAPWDSNPEPTA